MFPTAAPALGSMIAGEIQWRRFLPMAVPLGSLSGLFGVFGIFGLLPLIASVIFAIRRYRPYHPGELTRRAGALLGATVAACAVLPLTLIVGLAVRVGQNELHQELIRRASEMPELHNFAAWIATREGFVIMIALSTIFYMGLMIAVASITGALAITPGKNRNRNLF